MSVGKLCVCYNNGLVNWMLKYIEFLKYVKKSGLENDY